MAGRSIRVVRGCNSQFATTRGEKEENRLVGGQLLIVVIGDVEDPWILDGEILKQPWQQLTDPHQYTSWRAGEHE